MMDATLLDPIQVAPLPQTESPGLTMTVVHVAAEDRYIRSKIIVLDWVMTILAGTVVALRIYSKYKRRLRLWWDDYIVLVSLTLLLAFAIVTVSEVLTGTGRHATNLDAGTLREFALLATVASTLAILTTAVARTGFAVSLLKVAAPQGWPRRLAWAVIVLSNTVSGLAALFLWLQCTPVRKNWDRLDFGYCWSPGVQVAVPIINTSVGGVLNVLISMVGLYIVRKNTTKQRDWVGALVLAALGIFSGVASWVKTSVMHILVGNDVTFDIVTLIVWGIIEPAVVIIAGSLPELRSFVWRSKPPSVPSLIEDPFTRRRNGIHFDSDFEFARQQYLEAGGKNQVLVNTTIV